MAKVNLDLRNICRICLDEVSECTDLFSGSFESQEILKKIHVCFQVTIKPENYLPCVICNKCIEELKIADSFRLKCNTFVERFEKYYDRFSKTYSKVPEANRYPDDNLCIDGDIDCELDNTENTYVKDSTFKCEKCNKVLKSMKSLLKHTMMMHDKRRHIGKVSGFGALRRYHCTSCSYSTPHSQTLVNHMRRHNGERPFNCECGKNFTQASSLAAHRKIHSTTSYFTCSECGKQFKHAFSLKTHLRVHSEGSFICKICAKALKSKETLHAHIKRHYKVYNFNCEDCGDTFITSGELHNHRLKHGTNKKINCHICDFTTNSKKSLVIHIKRHVGDRAFKCSLCIKTFYTQGDMRRHLRVHTREKPFSCQTCAQRFTYSTSLNKHMQTVHGIQYKWGDVKWKEARMKKVSLKVA